MSGWMDGWMDEWMDVVSVQIKKVDVKTSSLETDAS